MTFPKKLPGGLEIPPYAKQMPSAVLHKKRPHVGILIGNAHYILFKELEHLMDRVENGQELTPAESTKFSRYVKTLTELAKEEREQDAEEDPRKLSDTELRKAAVEALKQLDTGAGGGSDDEG